MTPSSTGSVLTFVDAPEVEFILVLDPAELPVAAVLSSLCTCTTGAMVCATAAASDAVDCLIAADTDVDDDVVELL